jgi:hypothetical protein
MHNNTARESKWDDLFGPSDSEISECEDEAGQPVQASSEGDIMMETEYQSWRGAEVPLRPKASNLRAVRGSSRNNSAPSKGKASFHLCLTIYLT